MIDDFFKCYEIDPITNIEKIQFSQQGNFEIKYKYYVNPIKYMEFSKKWCPILEKIKISKTTLSDKELKERTGSTYNAKSEIIRNTYRKDNTLSLIITDNKKTKFPSEYIIPGFIVDRLNGHTIGLKNHFFDLYPNFTFVDKNQKIIKEFKYIGNTTYPDDTKWKFSKKPILDNLFFDPNSKGTIELSSSMTVKDLANSSELKAELKKTDTRPKDK